MWPFRTKPATAAPERNPLQDELDAATARGNAEAAEAIRRGSEITRLTAANLALAGQHSALDRARRVLATIDKEKPHG